MCFNIFLQEFSNFDLFRNFRSIVPFILIPIPIKLINFIKNWVKIHHQHLKIIANAKKEWIYSINDCTNDSWTHQLDQICRWIAKKRCIVKWNAKNLKYKIILKYFVCELLKFYTIFRFTSFYMANTSLLADILQLPNGMSNK